MFRLTEEIRWLLRLQSSGLVDQTDEMAQFIASLAPKKKEPVLRLPCKRELLTLQEVSTSESRDSGRADYLFSELEELTAKYGGKSCRLTSPSATKRAVSSGVKSAL